MLGRICCLFGKHHRDKYRAVEHRFCDRSVCKHCGKPMIKYHNKGWRLMRPVDPMNGAGSQMLAETSVPLGRETIFDHRAGTIDSTREALNHAPSIVIGIELPAYDSLPSRQIVARRKEFTRRAFAPWTADSEGSRPLVPRITRPLIPR